MRFLPSVLATLTLGLAPLAAQPQPVGGHTVATGYSRSAQGNVTRGGSPAGEVGVSAVTGNWRSSATVSAATRLNYGVNWEHFDFDRTAAAVPGTLQEVSATLGLMHRFNPEWIFTGTVRPGFYGDLKGGNGDAFNAPLLLLTTWTRSPTLAWAFGLRADWFSERRVIPLIGVNYKFAPGWTFNLGMPRAGISYEASPQLKFTLGASVQGGNFHVTRDPRPSPVPASLRLDDTKLDYHEIRVGLAAERMLNATFSLTVEAGIITDQKFDYFARNYRLDGGDIGFLTLGLTGRF